MQFINSATFWLWMFLMVSNFKEKTKSQTSKSSKQIYIRIYLSLSPRYHMDPSHFTKRNWLRAGNRVEYPIENTVLSTGMVLNWDIFMKCLSLNSSNIAKVQRWSWTYLCGKQIHGKKLIVIRAKVMVQNKL